jgi:hypothetical protein
MAQADSALVDGILAASPLSPKYGPRIDRESAYEILLRKVAVPPIAPPPAAPAPSPGPTPRPSSAPKAEKSFLEKALGSPTVRITLRTAATAAGREIVRSIFGTARRRR